MSQNNTTIQSYSEIRLMIINNVNNGILYEEKREQNKTYNYYHYNTHDDDGSVTFNRLIELGYNITSIITAPIYEIDGKPEESITYIISKEDTILLIINLDIYTEQHISNVLIINNKNNQQIDNGDITSSMIYHIEIDGIVQPLIDLVISQDNEHDYEHINERLR